MEKYRSQATDVNTPYGLFMIFLNLVAVVVALFSFSFGGLSDGTRDFLIRIDVVLSIILLVDFAQRLSKVPMSEFRQFLVPWGFIDFLGCLPAMPLFRIFRLIRIGRLVQAVRQVGFKQLIKNLREQLAASSLWGVVALTIPTIFVSGWWIFTMETENCLDPAVNANICTLGDGVWWAFVTVTTVGYGDYYPVSNGGRVLAGVLMTIGVGLFGILTSYLATIFIRQEEEQLETDLSAELSEVKQELSEIKMMLRELQSEKTTK
ncbi:MAG: potassium channel family protein [Anaerolineae bacterium]